MTKLTALETDLKAARDDLTALQNDLPQFHALLTDNEQDATRLKTDRASLDAQAQAKGRVSVAKEMLEQHQSDIENAEREVARAEATVRHETMLSTLVKHAKRSTSHRATFVRTLEDAHKELEKYVTRLMAAWEGMNAERQAFVAEAMGSSSLFRRIEIPRGMSEQTEAEEDAKAQALLRELKARGADMTAVLTPHDGRRLTVFDQYDNGFNPPERFGRFIMSALASEVNKDQELTRAELLKSEAAQLAETMAKASKPVSL